MVITNESHKHEVDIEGEFKPWDSDTITTEQVAALGDWNPAEGVILVNLDDGTERTLEPGEEIKLQADMGFSRKVLFKRG